MNVSTSSHAHRGMRRLVVASAIVALAVVACASPSGGTTADPEPAVSPASGATPSATTATATATATAAPSTPDLASPSAAEGSFTVEPGDPWLVYGWFPESLFLVRPDGSDRHRLPLDIEGEPFAPSWSADGERLVFVVRDRDTPNGSIWTADANGANLAPLYGQDGECNDGAFWPVWSPDGSRLAMICYDTRNEAGETSISILDPATGARTDLASLKYPETTDNPPSWAPDGSALAFEIIRWDPTDQFVESSVVATIPADGGDITRLTDPALFAGHPDWSPDGTRIAFNDYDTGNIHGIDEPSNVFTIAPDGTDLRQLSTASTDGKMRIGQPFWSSDGSRIWVSVARDWEKDSTGQFSNTLGWVDASSGAFTEIGTEGKRFRERPS